MLEETSPALHTRGYRPDIERQRLVSIAPRHTQRIQSCPNAFNLHYALAQMNEHLVERSRPSRGQTQYNNSKTSQRHRFLHFYPTRHWCSSA
jgi:hypothetical protein